jgi:hypothetical protein
LGQRPQGEHGRPVHPLHRVQRAQTALQQGARQAAARLREPSAAKQLDDALQGRLADLAADNREQRRLQVVQRRKLGDDQTAPSRSWHRACLGQSSAGPARSADRVQLGCQPLGQGVATLLGDP